MGRLRDLVFGAFILCVTFSNAHALTEEEYGRLNDLVSQATSTSQGVDVAGARIVADEGALLQGEQACAFSRLLNADEECDTTAIVFPRQGVGIDTIYYSEPEDIGHVNMDDWTEDVKSQIDEIWDSYVEGSKAQSKRIGFDVVPLKWVLYPTLNKAAKVMTYGILLDFGGTHVINLVSVKFTRKGYVVLKIVTDEEILAADSASFDSVSVYASDTYKPAVGWRYADFKNGDKVAAVGAVGVLASVIGVKYGKGWLAGIGAMILLFAKKLWVLFLVVPAAIWGGIKKLVGRHE